MDHKNKPKFGNIVLLVCLLAGCILSFGPALAGYASVSETGPSGTGGLYLPLVKNRPGIGTVGHLLITEVLFDPSTEQGNVEWIEILNPTGSIVDLHPYKIGDEETLNENEGMLQFPPGATIGVGMTILVAKDANVFESAFGFLPDYEFSDSGSAVPEMFKYSAWAAGNVVLTNSGDEVLLLDVFDDLVDAVSWGSSGWAFEPDLPVVPKGHSIERVTVFQDTDTSQDWHDQADPTPGKNILSPPAPTPTPGPSPTPFGGGLLISEVVFDAAGSEPGEEWVEIHNLTPGNLDLSDFKIGDEETAGGSEGMYGFPEGSLLQPGELAVVANQAAAFEALYGFKPDFEFNDSDPLVPDMFKYLPWAGGSISLSNAGDEILLLDSFDLVVDAVSWGSSTWAFDPPAPTVGAGESIERFPAGSDTDTAADWREQTVPSPGSPPADGQVQ